MLKKSRGKIPNLAFLGFGGKIYPWPKSVKNDCIFYGF